MNSDELASNSPSPDTFKNLINNLKNEKTPIQRSLISTALSEALLLPHGFVSYFDYLSSLSEDSLECVNLFCKIALTRPSKFTDDMEYLLFARENFYEIALVLLESGNDQNLRVFLTKLFYFLRKAQNEDHFGFFLEPLRSKSAEFQCVIFEKLCKWDFYLEDLSKFFLETLKVIINYKSNSNILPEIWRTSASAGLLSLSFKSLYLLFSELEISDIDNILHDFNDINIMDKIFEPALAASFPDTRLFESFHELCDELNPSDMFNSILREKSKNIEYDINFWGKYIKTNSVSNSVHTDSLEKYMVEIFTNIRSEDPVDVAFGLHSLRQKVAENSGFEPNIDVIDTVIKCLFSDESFVFMNAIKTCSIIGQKYPSLLCDVVLKATIHDINESNIIFLPRFIEIFDNLLVESNDSSSISYWTSRFLLYCIQFSETELFEIRCAIINYLIDIVHYDYSCFFHNQLKVWSSFNLSTKNFAEMNFETEAFFKLINSYLEVIEIRGRHLAKDVVLSELEAFLRRSYSSNILEVSIMARNNIMTLETIRNGR